MNSRRYKIIQSYRITQGYKIVYTVFIKVVHSQRSICHCTNQARDKFSIKQILNVSLYPPQKKILQRNYFKKTTNSCGIKPEPPRTKYSLNCKTTRADIFNLQAPCVLYIGQAFRYSPENDFYVFNQQIYFII